MHHDLQEQIRRGELRAGDRVPSENRLAEAYQVSRQTVRKALAILEQEGAIYAVHGKGTFVSERVRPEHKSHNIAVVTTYLSDYIFPRVIQGIDEVLTAQGYSILLKNTRNSRSQEAKCLEEYGIPYVFIQGCFDRMEDNPQEGILRLLSKGMMPEAIVCYNDQIAMQVIPALTARGIRVPEDISVTGYDNSYMAMGGDFHLTTIVHPQEKLGEMAAQLLLSLLRGEAGEKAERRILIQPELVVGNSCRLGQSGT